MSVTLSGLANVVRLGTIISIDSEKAEALVRVPEITLTLSETGGSDGGGGYYTTDLSLYTATSQVNRTCKVLTRGSKTIKDYFNYEVGEPVICVFPAAAANGMVGTSSIGYIVGTFFEFESLDRDPGVYYEKVRLIDFGDGTSISYNMADKELAIECAGDVTINGKNIYLNG